METEAAAAEAEAAWDEEELSTAPTQQPGGPCRVCPPTPRMAVIEEAGAEEHEAADEAADEADDEADDEVDDGADDGATAAAYTLAAIASAAAAAPTATALGAPDGRKKRLREGAAEENRAPNVDPNRTRAASSAAMAGLKRWRSDGGGAGSEQPDQLLLRTTGSERSASPPSDCGWRKAQRCASPVAKRSPARATEAGSAAPVVSRAVAADEVSEAPPVSSGGLVSGGTVIGTASVTDASVAAPPGDASITACGDGGASGGVAAEAEAAEVGPALTAMRRRDGVEYAPLERERGALVAPSRTGEGYKLPCGTGLTCLVDATFNGIMALAPSVKPSLARMVAKAVPTLGNVRQASWASMQAALVALQYPVALVEATARFMAAGGPMLNMLSTKGAVLVVGLHVRIDGVAQQHCVMLSTLPEPHAPYGKLVDNHGQMRPVYLEAKDLASKPAAARAFRELIAQNPAARECTELIVESSDVYELVATGAGVKRPAEASVGPAKAPRLGERVCAACGRALPTEAFSKAQRAKGPNGCCRECVHRE